MFAKAVVILPNYAVTNQNYVAFFFVFLPICGIFRGVLHHCDGKRKHASPKTTIYITSIGQVTLQYAPKRSGPEVSGSNPAFLTMIR